MTIFTNKNIIIVGNSVELINHEYGEFIDSHDIVIRLGRGFKTQDYPKSLGSKIDVWATGFLRANMHKHKKLQGIPILLNRNRMNLDKPRKHEFGDREVIETFTDKELKDLHKEFKYPKDRRLSNGLLTLLYFTRKDTTWKSLKIIGMDCFSKSLSFNVGLTKPFSWHMPINNADYNPHLGGVEKGIIIEETSTFTNFKWVILSDLHAEDIL